MATKLSTAKQLWDKPDLGKLILRVGVSLMMLTHGIPKMMKIFNGNWAFANPIGVGEPASLILTVFAEVICSVLLIIGFKTRLSTIPLLITMLVAAFIVHGADPWNKKEFALIYALIYLVIFLVGPGRYSVDKK